MLFSELSAKIHIFSLKTENACIYFLLSVYFRTTCTKLKAEFISSKTAETTYATAGHPVRTSGSYTLYIRRTLAAPPLPVARTKSIENKSVL